MCWERCGSTDICTMGELTGPLITSTAKTVATKCTQGLQWGGCRSAVWRPPVCPYLDESVCSLEMESIWELEAAPCFAILCRGLQCANPVDVSRQQIWGCQCDVLHEAEAAVLSLSRVTARFLGCTEPGISSSINVISIWKLPVWLAIKDLSFWYSLGNRVLTKKRSV